MMGFKNQKLNEIFQKDDAERIANFIIEACQTLKNNYGNSVKVLPNDENKIRNILVEEYLDEYKIRKRNQMTEYRFAPETQENYDGNGSYLGRADIKIILKTDFEKNDAYYLVECKRLDGSVSMNKKYLTEGVNRFVTQKYSAHYGKNFMLGFVVGDIDIQNNAKNIEGIQNTLPDIKMHGQFCIEGLNGNEEAWYKCSYQLGNGELELSHIFSNMFSAIH